MSTNSNSNTSTTAVELEPVICGLCPGRHPLPVDAYIFDGVITIEDDKVVHDQHLHEQAARFIREHCLVEGGGARPVTLYVTGYTPATMAFVAEAAKGGVHLTMMHFDQGAPGGGYWAQPIF